MRPSRDHAPVRGQPEMKRLITAADMRDLARRGETRLALAPDDMLTAEAEDVASRSGVAILRDRGPSEEQTARASSAGSRPVKLVRGSQTSLLPFAFDVKRPEMNIRTTDVLGDADGSPMGAGYMSLERGSFPWTLNYDEVDIVLEGVLVIKVGDENVEGHAGDIIYIPKGTSIEFSTPTRCRFVYVTFPANWGA